ncbi:MAG: hypothetical protein COA99_14045 [Moraxellaceae bacterium]|nr:MAG: hypothetical protein COA99_14045 [Moraxellaceae bacterium]
MIRANDGFLVLIGLLISLGMLVSNLVYFEWIRHLVDALANDQMLNSTCNSGDSSACMLLYERFSSAQAYIFVLYTFIVYFALSWGLTVLMLRSKQVSIFRDTCMILLLTVSVMVGGLLAEVVSVESFLIHTMPVLIGVLFASWFLQASRQNNEFEDEAKDARHN